MAKGKVFWGAAAVVAAPQLVALWFYVFSDSRQHIMFERKTEVQATELETHSRSGGGYLTKIIFPHEINGNVTICQTEVITNFYGGFGSIIKIVPIPSACSGVIGPFQRHDE
jgi:hypothetical protein